MVKLDKGITILLLGGESGGSTGLEIVAASGTTLNAEVGKYYRYDSDVSNLTVSLPAPTDNTHDCTIKFYFSTSSSPNVSFTSTFDVISNNNYEISLNSVYEITATYNGTEWILSSKIVLEIGDRGNNILLHLIKTLKDESIYNRTTSTMGTVTPNYNNEGILLGGESGLILDTGIKNMILNNDFSISLDVKLVSAYTRNGCIISMGGSNTAGGGASLILENSVISKVAYYALGYKISQNFSGSLNTWYRYEFKKQGGHSYILVNGNVIGTSDYVNTNNAADFAIGFNQSASEESINGIVKNVIIKLL